MQRASAVSVWGATLAALAILTLIFLQSGPVGAQTDPLAGQTANIEANTIGPIAVARCEADQDDTARIRIADENENKEAFTEDNAEFEFGPQGITIKASDDNDLNFLGDLNTGQGSVVSSAGITCGDDDTGANGNGRGEADTPAEDQYESNDVILKTVPNKPLPKTGGVPLILGAGVLLALAALLSIRVLRG